MATVDPARGVGAGSPGADELTRGEVNLVARSIRERWPTHPRIKEAILTKVARVGLKSENPRIVFSAFRCIAMAERQNQLDQHRAQPEVVAHVHLGAEAREAVRDLSVEELRIMRRIRMRVVGGAGAGGGDEADAGTEAGLDGIEEALEREQERKGKR